MRLDDRTAVVLVDIECLGLQKSVAGATAIVASDELVVALALHRLKSTEEEGCTNGVFEHAQAKAGKYALRTNGFEFMPRVVPHCLVLPL